MARKNEFGGSWWAKEWISALENFGWASRLQRGRSYARAGNVLSIDLGPGSAEARVQGSRRRPYKVQIRMKPLSEPDWDRVTTAMAGRAAFAASLLAGEMPENIEDAFAQCDAPLFPASEEDLATSCTCPDWANPCKHIAAVYYILAQEFDRDPFLLFLLRGKSKEDLLTSLRYKRSQAVCRETPGSVIRDVSALEDTGCGMDAESTLAAELCPSPEQFWNGDIEGLNRVAISIAPPRIDAAAVKRLGAPPLWNNHRTRSSQEFIRIMDRYCKAVTRRAMVWAYGDDTQDAPGDNSGFSCDPNGVNGATHKKSM